MPTRTSGLVNVFEQSCLIPRYKQTGGIGDVNEAIVLARGALSLCPPGHLDRSTFLNNLAACLISRYNKIGGIEDVNEAIIIARDALSLCPPGHPDVGSRVSKSRGNA